MTDYLHLFFAAVFVNNIVLTQFLGICPFIGVSKKTGSALGMAMAVVLVTTLSSMLTWIAARFLLIPLEIEYLQTAVFILIIATLVQLLEMLLKKVTPTLFRALGIYLPLITTNCAILGVAISNIRNETGFLETAVHGFSTAVGFGMVLILFAGIREKLEGADIPKPLRGTPVALVSAGIMTLLFAAFGEMK